MKLQTHICTCAIYPVLVIVHDMYCMAGSFGGEINLVIWQSSAELPNFISPNFVFSSCKNV